MVKLLSKRLGHGAWLTTRIGMSIAFVSLTLSVSAIGAYSTFTGTSDTSSSNPSYSTCTVTLAAITPNAANNRLTLGATALVPGDTMQRTVNVKNTGSSCLNSSTPVKLTTKASGCVGTCSSSLLDTDATNGLQVVIDKCSVAWTESGTSPAYTYTCGGTTTSVLASTSLIQTNATLNNLVGTANTDNFLRVTLTLPSGAGNTFQGLTSQVEFAFVAQQRAATSM
ncbi:MAG: TasA family protein [Acidimicrobiia bacterium]